MTLRAITRESELLCVFVVYLIVCLTVLAELRVTAPGRSRSPHHLARLSGCAGPHARHAPAR